MLIDFNRVLEHRQGDDREKYLMQLIDQCAPDDPPFLSDVLVNLGRGGQDVLIELGDVYESSRDLPLEQRLQWKIMVLCDEWGNAPSPGDIIPLKRQKSLNRRNGKPFTGHELSAARVDGSYEARFINKVEYKVDEKGCINCNFQDAVYFLNTYGVHSSTGYAMTTKPEFSSEPDKRNKLHVHYWRYKEIQRKDYKQLPNIKPVATEKRGKLND